MLHYKALTWLDFDQLFDGRLAAYGVEEVITPRTTPDLRLLVAGDAPLWCERSEKYGMIGRRGGGAPLPFVIQEAIYEAFQVEVVSENDFRYDGFESQEQRNAAYDLIHEGALSTTIVKTPEEALEKINERMVANLRAGEEMSMSGVANEADWIEVEGSDGLDLGKYTLRIESRRLLEFVAKQEQLPYGVARRKWVERTREYADEFIHDLVLDVVDEVTGEGPYAKTGEGLAELALNPR